MPRPTAARRELARGLIALGAGKGTHVGLLYPNGAAFVVGDAGGGANRRRGHPVLHVRHRSRDCASNWSTATPKSCLAAASFRSHDYVQRLAEADRGPTFDSDDRLFAAAAPQLRQS